MSSKRKRNRKVDPQWANSKTATPLADIQAAMKKIESHGIPPGEAPTNLLCLSCGNNLTHNEVMAANVRRSFAATPRICTKCILAKLEK